MTKVILFGLLLVLIGTLIIFAGIFSMTYQAWKAGGIEKPEARGAGVVMIGPIPIIFGTDIGALKMVMILAIVLMIVAALFLFFSTRMF
jgi:uncharacterized protein (TIGR00304 family)